MKITLNGIPMKCRRADVDRPARAVHIDPRRVAVEHNLNVVKRAEYARTEIRDGDQIEIVNFVGGGTV